MVKEHAVSETLEVLDLGVRFWDSYWRFGQSS